MTCTTVIRDPKDFVKSIIASLNELDYSGMTENDFVELNNGFMEVVQKIYLKCYEVEKILVDIVAGALTKGGLLKKATWVLDYVEGNLINLRCSSHSTEILNRVDHCDEVKLGNSCTLIKSCGLIHLQFLSLEGCKTFVDEWELEVDFGRLDDEIERSGKRLNILKEISKWK